MLDGLDEKQARQCSYYLEYIVTWQLKNEDPYITNDYLFSNAVISAIKKAIAISGFNGDIDCEKIYNRWKDICKEEPEEKEDELTLKLLDELTKKETK